MNVTVRHTSASLTINENADPSVRVDMENALNRIAPESWNRPGGAVTFNHVDEGDDDMPAHVKSTLFGASLTVPVASVGKKLALGTWQGVYLCEHRDAGGFGGGHARDVTATTMGREGDAAGQTTVTITAPGRGCHDVTSEIEKAVADVGSGVRTGVARLASSTPPPASPRPSEVQSTRASVWRRRSTPSSPNGGTTSSSRTRTRDRTTCRDT